MATIDDTTELPTLVGRPEDDNVTAELDIGQLISTLDQCIAELSKQEEDEELTELLDSEFVLVA